MLCSKVSLTSCHMASPVDVTCIGTAEHQKKVKEQDYNGASYQGQAFLGGEVSVCETRHLICIGATNGVLFCLGACLGVAPMQHSSSSSHAARLAVTAYRGSLLS